MTTIRISSPIIGEVYLRELWEREGDGMKVYTKIANAKSTRKDKSVTIDVNYDELFELHQEADYWSGNLSDYSMSRSLYMAYRSLAEQTKQLLKENQCK
jgi:ABC-type transporter lipoprotein component MlaA